jgi:hypothetical protein
MMSSRQVHRRGRCAGKSYTGSDGESQTAGNACSQDRAGDKLCQDYARNSFAHFVHKNVHIPARVCREYVVT